MATLKFSDGRPSLNLVRSAHNLSNIKIMDCNSGDLIPTAIYDCVPGDKFILSSDVLIRTTPLIKPSPVVNLKAKTASFFTAYRTVWKPFEDFFSGGRTGNKTVPLPVVRFHREISRLFSIYDYFGLPCESSNPILYDSNPPQGTPVVTNDWLNALYFLCYIKIWNDYFRNPSIDVEIDVLNLTIYLPEDDTPYVCNYTPPATVYYNNSVYTATDLSLFIFWCFGYMNGNIPSNFAPIFTKFPNTINSKYIYYTLPPVNLPRDLFTSLLPTFSTKNPVSLGLTGGLNGELFNSQNVVIQHNRYPNSAKPIAPGSYGLFISGDGLTTPQTAKLGRGSLAVGSNNTITGNPDTQADGAYGNLLFNTSSLNSAVGNNSLSISGIYPRELRLVFALDLKDQLRTLTGNRYQDLLYCFYGVTTRDYRLNLSEYIGGSFYPIYVSEVLQTSETASTPQGNQSGHAIASGSNYHGSYFVEELGCIMNLFWINNSQLYTQCLRRDWRKYTLNDFFFPMFENLGDQEVLMEELVYSFRPNKNHNPNLHILGFTPRYQEYKFYNDTVCGSLRGVNRYWTQARIYSINTSDPTSIASYPLLNSNFIKPDLLTNNRIFQTIDSDTTRPYIVKFTNNTIAFRPMSDNTLGYRIDHF